MYILAIDTATNSGGVALARNREVIGLVLLKKPLRYSDCLIPMIDFLLRQHELQLSDMGCLAVASGPGSFTGLRIGLAAAKALGQALEIPALGVSTLDALAFGCRHWERPVAVMLDARRQQVYAAAYRCSTSDLECIVAPRVSRPEGFLQALPAGQWLFVGDGARLYRGAVESTVPAGRVLECDNRLLDALCALAFRDYGRGLARPVAHLAANYVRPPDVDASRKLG